MISHSRDITSKFNPLFIFLVEAMILISDLGFAPCVPVAACMLGNVDTVCMKNNLVKD